MSKQVHLLWDNTSVVHAAKLPASERDCTFAQHAFRLDYQRLYSLVCGDRHVVLEVIYPDELRTSFEALEDQGDLQNATLERAEFGSESEESWFVMPEPEVIDTFASSLRQLAASQTAGAIAIVSGDGAIFRSGSTLRTEVENSMRGGWRFEILLWMSACAAEIVNWGDAAGILVPLERYYYSITRIEGGRDCAPFTVRL